MVSGRWRHAGAEDDGQGGKAAAVGVQTVGDQGSGADTAAGSDAVVGSSIRCQ